jgi:CubicO group peptidase (beta-lactamase class C family)
MKMKSLITPVLYLAIAGRMICSGQVDQYLEQLSSSHVIPGFAVAIVQKDRIVFKKGYGLEYTGGKVPVSENSSFLIGSIAKSLTAIAVLQLEEKGKINLDDKVVKYLPWFRTANKEMSDSITVRMLLDNTSGLQAAAVRNRDNSDMAAENLAHSLESVYLTSEPGKHYEYSNDGFALAGLIISKVSDLPYEKYLEKYIFKPLEMFNTTNSPASSEKHLMLGHYPGVRNGIPVCKDDAELPEYVAAGSMLRSTAGDMANYLIALVNSGKFRGKQITSPGSLNEIWNSYSSFPGIELTDGGNGLRLGYGLGWFIGEIEGRKIIFHGGNRRTMSSMTAVFPEEKIAIVFLANIDLTMIDRFKYPTLINIVNNILRTYLNEKPSKYAVPVVPDPTINIYSLPFSDSGKYTGDYLLTEGRDWVYLGSHLLIRSENNELSVEIKKGRQTIETFKIDFVSARSAVSRNLAMPHKMTFRFSGTGRVSDVFFDDKKYSKLSEGYYKKFVTAKPADGTISILVPRNWIIKWNGLNFNSENQDDRDQKSFGRIIDKNREWTEYYKELFPNHTIVRTGLCLDETFSDKIFTELAFISTCENVTYYNYLCYTYQGSKGYLILNVSRGHPDLQLSSVVPTVLRSFEWDVSDSDSPSRVK